MYYVATDSRDEEGVVLFRVDRLRYRDRWWTKDSMKAHEYPTRQTAQAFADGIRYNNPRVIPYWEAEQISEEQLCDEHPFSSEGHGQF